MNWLFLWSTVRPPIWEATTENLNQGLNSSEYMIGLKQKWVPPINWKEIPGRLLREDHKKRLNGQMLNQFEGEEFKFVIEKNNSQVNPEDELVIKPHMFPTFALSHDKCKTLNLKKLKEYFKNYEWVALGFFFEDSSDLEYNERAYALSSAILYARNGSNKIVNIETGEMLDNYDHLHCNTYVVFRLLSDENYVVATVNPHLVSVPFLHNEFIGNDTIITMNTFNTSFDKYMIEPAFENCNVVNNTIFANKNFNVNLYEDAWIYLRHSQIPNFPVKVETNLKYTSDKNKYTFEPKKGMGYIRFKVHTKSINKKYNNIEKAGYEILEYTVVGE